MPSRWQQWMPFRIDAFKGSPAVQAMHPAARIGYLYLLVCSWQTEDCTLSCDPLELAEQSGLGDELWAVHGQRILRKFEWTDESHSRLRNNVLFDEWKEAKRVFDARRQAADRTNSSRSPHGHRDGEVSAPSRSADTHTRTGTGTGTGTGTKTETETQEKEPRLENFDSGEELSAANWLLEELGTVADNGVRRVAADAIRLLAKEGGTIQTAAEYILQAGHRAREQGEVINRFWFTDQRYRPVAPKKSKRQLEREAREEAFMKGEDEA